MTIVEKIKSFLGIPKNIEEILDKPSKPIKPISYPAKVLFIDYGIFTDIYYQEDFGYLNFKREIQENLINFQFVRDLLEASAQIQLDPPDLIISELFLPYCQLIEGDDKSSYCGYKIFKILDRLDLDFEIPVIFYTNMTHEPKNRAIELGAYDCIYKNQNDTSLKSSIQKVLKF